MPMFPSKSDGTTAGWEPQAASGRLSKTAGADEAGVFTLRLLDTAGNVGDEALQAFLASGYTRQNALEVVLGIGTYTMSTLANRLTGAPIDDPLRGFAWSA